MIAAEVALLVLACFDMKRDSSAKTDRQYRVDCERVSEKLKASVSDGTEPEYAASHIDLSDYDTILNVSVYDGTKTISNDYVVCDAGGVLYCIEYRADAGEAADGRSYAPIIALSVLLILLNAALLIYIYVRIIKPFNTLSELPAELAKGHMNIPIKEEHGKTFGRYLWGMDMLREKLEENRQRALDLEREKKTLILSLSHDIKTPLSSIELYSGALSEGLYEDEDKRKDAALAIRRSAKEIKSYIDEIQTASRQDFLRLTADCGEVYFSDVVSYIVRYYTDKLAVLHTRLVAGSYDDCLISGDCDRLIEVIQNIMENAIKYGDGKLIVLSFSDEEDCRLMRIENSGKPVDASELTNIFDSFYRGKGSKGVAGSGLGLYICRELMSMMDGDVYAENTDNGFAVTVVMRKL